MTRRIVRVLIAIGFDLIDAATYFAAIALVTALIGLLLPLPVSFAIALLGVSVWHGYRTAQRIERARMRGEEW